MFFNQRIRLGITSGVAGLLLAAAGCSSQGPMMRADDAAAAPGGAAAPSIAGPAAEASSAEAASARADANPRVASEAAGAPRPLSRADVNPNAPMSYTVKRGDTLWGISSLFLRDPWLWPEIWYDNPRIENPHRIYPGDVLVLAYSANGQPRVYVEHGGRERLQPRLRGSPLDGAIPTIPYSDIAAFLSRPAILSTREVNRAPHVLAFRDEHQVAGAGENAYVRGLDAPAGARFVVMHIGEKLYDPDSGRLLGYQALYTATATVVRPGDPAKVTLSDPERETLRGDCLFPDERTIPLNVVPRAPAHRVYGRIISVVGNVDAVGQYDIVAINRGTSHGVDAGTVLAVDQAGVVVPDRGVASFDMWGRDSTFAHHVQLPEERAGTLLVFKSYDDMSYALVVGASEQMQVADIVRNP